LKIRGRGFVREDKIRLAHHDFSILARSRLGEQHLATAQHGMAWRTWDWIVSNDDGLLWHDSMAFLGHLYKVFF
jgi:predicted dithiol-disulfide oxidoreductase (DUF899 family)